MNIYHLSRTLAREQAFDIKYYQTGIARVKIKKGFVYYYIKNKKPVSKKDMKRILGLGVPPAWVDVWISPDPTTPIQAIGYDKKGIKQYIYHERHIKESEKKKFIRMYDFIKAIPKLEKEIEKDKKLGVYDKDRVIVSVLILINQLHLRIGKEVYVRRNKTYGASSLRKKHVKIEGDTIKLRFKGKSGKRLSYTLKNKELAKHLRLLLKLENEKLFQYINSETNKIRGVTDVDINAYVQSIMGKKFTIKDFRTYSANRFFVKALLNETLKRSPKNEKVIKKNITNALKSVIYYMRHTMTVSKKSYVLHFAINLYQENPDYFVDRIESDPDDLLIDILKLYRKKVIKI